MVTQTQTQQVVAGPVPDGQTQLIAQGNTLVRLENDTQMSIAIQKPRNEGDILQAALAELDLYPSCAEEAIYLKPVGKDDTGKMRYAEGLSIRTAESLSNRWGNNAYGCDIVEETADHVVIAAVWLDYETNIRRVFQRRVSKFYKTRNNQIVQYKPDRFDMTVSAAMSKLLREAILRSLPSGLKKEYELKARKVLGEAGNVGKRIEAMVAAFGQYGITVDQLENLRGKTLAQFNGEDLTDLIGVFNAIKNGEIEASEAFGQGTDGGKEERPNLKPTNGISPQAHSTKEDALANSNGTGPVSGNAEQDSLMDAKGGTEAAEPAEQEKPPIQWKCANGHTFLESSRKKATKGAPKGLCPECMTSKIEAA